MRVYLSKGSFVKNSCCVELASSEYTNHRYFRLDLARHRTFLPPVYLIRVADHHAQRREWTTENFNRGPAGISVHHWQR